MLAYTNEDGSKYKNIVISKEDTESSIEGYVCGIHEENWKNFILKRTDNIFAEKTRKLFEVSNVRTIGIIHSLYVPEEHRNQGIGTELLDDMINEMDFLQADMVILESDESESNSFNLTEWYLNKFQFKKIPFEISDYKNPILMLDINA